MPYITKIQLPKVHQITFDELMSGLFDDREFKTYGDGVSTRTYYTDNLSEKFLDKFNFAGMMASINQFYNDHKNLYEAKRANLYTTFHIPKKSGGLRRIDAPCDELKDALRELGVILKGQFFALYHTSAFAYVNKRWTMDALKKHQDNASKWLLKIDFSNFFNSTTPKFLEYMLSQVFPFSVLFQNPTCREQISRALDLCFLDGGLPQGSPISPMLTNLIMIPIDHRLCNTLMDFDKHRFVYTRYADDILISCKYDFDKDSVLNLIDNTLKYFGAPYTIKPEKTRYSSSAGSNWNLGLMLNKDNEITIGHKNRERFRAMVHNFCMDYKNGISWELHDVQVLQGLANYYRQIEKDNINAMIKKLEQKIGIGFDSTVKAVLSQKI